MKPVWHIYYGTRGIAGNYIDSLVTASIKAGLQVKAFVSSKYVYNTDNCIKCFFPLTDRTEKRNAIILLLRAIELIIAYMVVAIYATMKRPRINLHLIDDLNVTYFLIRYFKLIGLEVYITCHDVCSHYLGKTVLRSKLMSLADKLVVHNNNAKVTLINTIGENAETKVRTYPFPFSSYESVLDEKKQRASFTSLMNIIPDDKPFFLFLGVVKMQKGIEFLLNAWQESDITNQANLVIAGKWTDPPYDVRYKAEQDDSCIIIDRYLSDEEFVILIKQAHFTILPYFDYTHSSVLMSCGNHDGAVILSDIELFKEIMPDYPFYFSTDRYDELIDILNKTVNMNEEQVNRYRIMTKNNIRQERNELIVKLRDTYMEVM